MLATTSSSSFDQPPRPTTRQAYRVSWEDERAAAWRRGDPEPRSPWLEEHRAHAEHPELDHLREDFVVFDDTSVMYYRYTEDDRLTGYDFSDDPTVVAKQTALAEEVLAVATPLAHWSSADR